MASLKMLDKLEADAAKAQKRANACRGKLAKDCKHLRTEEYRWEHDNGYGRQSMQSGTICKICYKVDLWNSGRFLSSDERKW